MNNVIEMNSITLKMIRTAIAVKAFALIPVFIMYIMYLAVMQNP